MVCKDHTQDILEMDKQRSMDKVTITAAAKSYLSLWFGPVLCTAYDEIVAQSQNRGSLANEQEEG